jgi:hypothetical protein
MNSTLHYAWSACLVLLLVLTIDTYRRVRFVETLVTNIALQLEAVPLENATESTASGTEDEAAVEVMPDLMDDVDKSE